MDPNSQPPQEQVLYDAAGSEDLTPASPFPLKKIIAIGLGVIIVLIILIIAFMLISRPSSSGPVKLTYWGLWEDDSTFQQIISEYESKHPGVTIKYEKQDIKSRPEGYVNFLISRIRSGTGPDIFRFHSSWLPQIHNYTVPLPDSVLSATQFHQQYYSAIQNDMTWGNAVYGIPMYVDTLAMFVNDDVLKAGGYKAPTDWNSLMNLSRNLTTPDPTTGQIKTSAVALGTYDNIDHASDIAALFFAQNGVSIADLIGADPTKAAAARSSVTDALKFYTCFAVTNEQCQTVWDKSMDESKLAFAEGKLGIFFGYSWDVLDIRHINPNLAFTVHPVPASNGQNKTVASYWAEGVSKNSQYQKQAFDFFGVS